MLFSQIMKLALQQLTHNAPQVLRIGLVSLIIYVGGMILVDRFFASMSPGAYIHPYLAFTIILLPVLLSTIPFGVNLSRALILGERFGWLPRIYPGAILRYGLATLMLLIFAFALSWLLGFLNIVIVRVFADQSLMAVLSYLAPILNMLSVTIIAMFMLRLGSAMPAFAIGQSFQDALAITGVWRSFLSIAFITQVILAALTWGLTGLSSLIINTSARPEGAALVWIYALTVIAPLIITLLITLYMFSITIAAYRILVQQTDEIRP